MRLMLAVLDDALGTILSQADRRTRLWFEAAEWIASAAREWPFSFLNICDVLDIDALRLRRRLTPWLERTAQNVAPIRPRTSQGPAVVLPLRA